MENERGVYPFLAHREQLVHIVDPDPHTCEVLSINCRLEGYETQFSTAVVDALAAISRREPHAIVLNEDVADRSGLEILRLLRSTHRAVPVVVIQDHVDLDRAVRAMQLGANDVLAKPVDSERLLKALKVALEAQTIVHRDDKQISIAGFKGLTPREREILEFITNGQSNKETGRELGISPRTVEVHRARIMSKLGAKNTADLMRIVLTS
jgi:two-component system, LuxR family, response regulator FixJ